MQFQIDNVRALQIFQVLRQGAIILISILLAKTTLSIDEIGNFEMLMYIGTAVSFFWINGLIQGMLPYHPKLDDDEKRKFIFNIFSIFIVISGFIFLLLFFFEKNISLLLTGQSSLPYYPIFIIQLFFILPTYLIEYFYLLNDRPKRILVFGGFAFFAQILVVILPLFFGKPLLWSFYGLLILAVIRFIWLLLVVQKFGSFNFNSKLLQPYYVITFPLIGYAILSGFPAIFDNWLVGWFFQDEKSFALFRYGARELPIAIALAHALSAAMIPQISKNQQLAISTLKEKTLRIYHLIFPLSIILMSTSQYWFPLVFNPDFAESSNIFNVFLLVVISRVMFPQTILLALKKTKIILLISAIELLLNIILSLLFVQKFGLIGIAFGTVIAYSFEKIALAFYLFYMENISFGKYTPQGWFLFYNILLIAAYLI